MRPVLVVVLILGLALAALLALRSPFGASPAQRALATQVAGVVADKAGYTRIGHTLRARAWLLSAPGQPDGVALFTGLPDAVFGRERTIAPADLSEALRRIRGLAWDGTAQAWSGSGRTVPLAEVRGLLEAALPTPIAAAAILDLLLGEPAPGAPAFAALLQAEPPTLVAIRLVPFRGQRGRLLHDLGRPPFAIVERSYTGLVVAFEGTGWPVGWRVLTLR